jgi:hypothetical protein
MTELVFIILIIFTWSIGLAILILLFIKILEMDK